MKNVLRKSNLVAGVLILVVVCLGIVLAGDVIVKEGTVEGEKFKSTGCTATGTRAIAFGEGTTASNSWDTAMGYNTEASGDASTAMGYDTEASGSVSTAMGSSTTASGGASTAMGINTLASGLSSTAMGYYTTASQNYSTAMGQNTTASGSSSTAMGWNTTASQNCSTAMGYETTASGEYSTAMGTHTEASGYGSTAMGFETIAGPANFTTAIGVFCNNNVQNSFAVGFAGKDFSVESDLVKVYKNLYVTWDVDANAYSEHSTFYDKDTYGRALDYSEDSSRTIKLNAEGKKEYDHKADPVFLKKWVTVKDYNEYTEEEVWIEELNQTITRRIYETHQELRSNLSMKVAWLRQCAFELKEENQMLKDEIARLKEAVGIE